jgi:hypothetical protein
MVNNLGTPSHLNQIKPAATDMGRLFKKLFLIYINIYDLLDIAVLKELWHVHESRAIKQDA